jgi:hypothetical protein
LLSGAEKKAEQRTRKKGENGLREKRQQGNERGIVYVYEGMKGSLCTKGNGEVIELR